MYALDLVGASIPPDELSELPEEPSEGVCALTGATCMTVHRKHLLGPSFVDGHLLAMPDSDRVSINAYQALRYKWERMSSWFCDGLIFRRLDRLGVRDVVFGPVPSVPWAAYATTSYKKHGALRAPVNRPGRAVWLFENELVDVTPSAERDDVWQRLDHARRNGVPRPVIESLEPSSKVIRDYGLKEWMAFEAWARPRQNTSLYRFLTYLLPSEEELKNERKEQQP